MSSLSKVCMMEAVSKSEEDTFQAGYDFAKYLSRGDLVILDGELGVGKTFFIKGMAKFLGVENVDLVRSPSFSLVNQYETDTDLVVLHADLYRLETEEELESTALFDNFRADENIILIEWGSKLIKDEKLIDFVVDISVEPENHRLIRIVRFRESFFEI